MAVWPDADELKRVLDVDPESDVWAGTLDRILVAAIAHVKRDIGAWDDYDVPTDAQAQAALRLAELTALRPEVSASMAGTAGGLVAIARDPVYLSLLFGSRRRFRFA